MRFCWCSTWHSSSSLVSGAQQFLASILSLEFAVSALRGAISKEIPPEQQGNTINIASISAISRILNRKSQVSNPSKLNLESRVSISVLCLLL